MPRTLQQVFGATPGFNVQIIRWLISNQNVGRRGKEAVTLATGAMVSGLSLLRDHRPHLWHARDLHGMVLARAASLPLPAVILVWGWQWRAALRLVQSRSRLALHPTPPAQRARRRRVGRQCTALHRAGLCRERCRPPWVGDAVRPPGLGQANIGAVPTL